MVGMATVGAIAVGTSAVSSALGFSSNKKAYKQQQRNINQLMQGTTDVFNMQQTLQEQEFLQILERNKTVQASTGFESSDFDIVNNAVQKRQQQTKEIQYKEHQNNLLSIKMGGSPAPSTTQATLNGITSALQIYGMF